MSKAEGGAIEHLVRQLNEAWQAGDWDLLRRCYHENVVLLPPDVGEPIVGREAVLSTYRDFADSAQLHTFSINRIQVFSFGNTHMVHMRFEVDYEFEGDRAREAGLEVYAVVGTDQPQVIWRQQSILERRTVPE